MPPMKRTREHHARTATANQQSSITAEVIAKRTRRHLDELERSNYTEASSSTFLLPDEADPDADPLANESSHGATRGRARQTISDKRTINGVGGIGRGKDKDVSGGEGLVILGNTAAAKKKKSTMNVRSALLYRKNLQTLIEESGISSLLEGQPSYLTALTSEPTYPPRILCTVCGYWGAYKCKKCAMAYCDRQCEDVHNETRCERRVG